LYLADQAALDQLPRVPVSQVEHLAGADLAHVVEKFAGCGYKHCCHPTLEKRERHECRPHCRDQDQTLPKSP
jgi:hypothetical protein